MDYRLLADLTLAVHAAFILFVALGGLLALRWPRVAWLHLPAAAWGAGIMFLGAICPLTYLENHFRVLAGQQGYPDGFIAHYLLGFVYPQGITRSVQAVLGALVVAGNAVVYAVLWRRRRRG
ncbi:Protein of Uncharacterised function (DUF2784) [Bordetella ansorpii]|uniref:Protein of Uncharacterized function (DUF2784) n=1 Tax=Bordetella ansorpii TaxID=288768 RepID=A0A157Q2V7_9BORD|nr:DUF2784 domain-containing protein [Bordetella ansorpii]SAI40212.1 Protein of Uncharacterised function (DUF2784) [Bordetella ansorpii]